jgi:phage terminase large subunit
MRPDVKLPNGWRPRDYQLPLWSYLEHGGLRADVVAHRRWGKDDVALHWEACAAHRRVGTYWHMLPEASQGRKAIWEAINPHTGKRRIDEAFPHSLRERTLNNEMFIGFKNGSSWQVVGSDNYNALVGAPPLGVVFSEWALAKPHAWTFIRPILLENGGWAIFIWTPRGRGHATRSFEARSQQGSGWFTQRQSALQTGVFTSEQLARERQELIDEAGSEEEGDSQYRQEYLVDFDAAVPGSYFGAQIKLATDEGRIGAYSHIPSLKVDAAWDIGVDDYTAIWFFQDNGKRVRAIDYIETSGEGPDTIVPNYLPELNPDREAGLAQLAELGRGPYEYRTHFLPHDVMVREWGAGAKARFQTLTEFGVKPMRVGVQQNPVERINAARRLLPVVCFDAKRCAAGLDRLRNYRKRWNKTTGVFGEPLHDENSHAADSFGEYAVNSRITPRLKVASEPPKDRWDGDDEFDEVRWKIA